MRVLLSVNLKYLFLCHGMPIPDALRFLQLTIKLEDSDQELMDVEGRHL